MTRGVLIFALLVSGLQWIFASAVLAVLVGLRILVLVCAANLLTCTTTTTDLVSVVEKVASPLARFGVNPERIGIAVSLTLRFIPVLAEQGAKIREAQAARGVHSRTAYLVPLLVRTLRMADSVGEALEVRGV
jgi:biotin transport system permease protein